MGEIERMGSRLGRIALSKASSLDEQPAPYREDEPIHVANVFMRDANSRRALQNLKSGTKIALSLIRRGAI
jgi:hypothetical protein